jgi:DNA polymerase-3 subunit gamma/tau
MEHISLYRKWRPQTFTEVIGQGRVTNTLANALSGGRLVHAYLFSGPRGTGKTSTARILAKAINCVEGPTATPCGVCEACVSISEGTALDVIELDAASNRKIDEIRDLLDKIPYTPTSLRTKVYIIDEVHQLTAEASSALLKTLEEPPGHVVFVLATTEPHKLLPTIVSRCQKFDFSLVSAQDMERLLEQIASHESIDIETEALAMIAEHAHGSVRDAIGVVDQISNLSGERVTQEQLADMLGEVEASLVFEMVDMITERDTAGTLSTVGNLVDDGKDPRRFVEALIGHLRSLFLVQNAANPVEIVEATDEHFERLIQQAKGLRRHEVMRLMERLGEAHREMRWSENPRLVLECVLVKITSLDADATLEGLAFRIDELERKIEALAAGAGPLPARGVPEAGREAAAPPASKTAPAKVSREPRPASTPAVEKKPGAPEAELPRAVGGAEPAAVNGPTASNAPPPDREKSRRAWMAVLAELKNTGQMKLYTLLARARVVSAGNGELVLGFGQDSVFQKEALTDSEDLVKVEQLWERFVGEPVKVRLTDTGRSAPAAPPAPVAPVAPPASKPGPTAKAAAESEPAKKATTESEVEAVGDRKEGTKSSAEIAQMIKERFDGEIISEKEGKE